MRIPRAVQPLLVFLFIGPIAGVVLLLALGSGLPPADGLFLILLFSYGIGCIPALVAGLVFTCAWHCREKLKIDSSGFVGLLLGAASGLVAISIFVIVTGKSITQTPLHIYSLSSFSGALCGFIVAAQAIEAISPDI